MPAYAFDLPSETWLNYDPEGSDVTVKIGLVLDFGHPVYTEEWIDADDPGGHGYPYAEPAPPPVHHGHVWDGEEWRGIRFLRWYGGSWAEL